METEEGFLGTYSLFGVGICCGWRWWSRVWFSLVLAFGKEGGDVAVEEEGKAAADGLEEGFVGFRRSKDEAVKDEGGSP